MYQGFPAQMPIGLRDKLLREGWSLHQRLEDSSSIEFHNSDSLDNWRQIVAPEFPENFYKRLVWDGLSLDQAAWALNPPVESVPQYPHWWQFLLAMCHAGRNALGESLYLQLEERGIDLPFVHVWRPASAWALESLRLRCSDIHPDLQLCNNAWLDLGESLLTRLCNTADQALWELFNQRRTPGQVLRAHLGVNGDGIGEPVRDAYDAFVEELLINNYQLLFTKYPVLGRLLSTITQLWLVGSEEMLRRLSASRSQLLLYFFIPSAAVLQKVQLGLSDPHRGGRAVAILTFSGISGTSKVVYKPKDMRVDHIYQQYLEALNNFSHLASLRVLKMFCGDGFGFMEFVEHRLCSCDADLANFYTNAGRLMAVLHLLGCTDCHYENLIASDDQLVLIDTETLLEADHRDLISDDGDDLDAISVLQASIRDSVLRSGLLPQWLMSGVGRKQLFDVSALGIQPPPPERQMPGWLGLNSDGMIPGSRSQPCDLPTCLPVALGSPQRLTDFVDELCSGFASQLQEAIRLRQLLSSALDGFKGKLRRLVTRNTSLYFSIQQQMLEPNSLRSAVEHGLKLEQLSRVFLLAMHKPINWPILRAELLQMERLDIPFFEHPIDGVDLPLPEGLASIENFMKASGFSAARRRIEHLDQTEIDFQQQLIRGAISARHMKPPSSTVCFTQAEADSVNTSQTSFLGADLRRQEAFQLAEELWDSAICDKKCRPEWLGMDLGVDGESFHFGLIGSSLYSGGSGIALLFARLALASDGASSELWNSRAWSCFENLAELADRKNNDQLYRLVRDLPFGLSGLGGILLALQLLKRAGLRDADALSERLIAQLRPARLLADEVLDVIGGVSGLIGPLLLDGTPRALELAIVCGERLLSLQLDNGGWSAGIGKPPLTGFSHGAAGIGASFARLALVSGVESFANGARQAVAYERSVFNSERCNWPDFRNINDPHEFMLSWCHGAPGILLSRRIFVEALFFDEHTSFELNSARSSTFAAIKQSLKYSGNPSNLCCGVLGLTSLLRVDSQFSDLSLAEILKTIENTVISNAQASGGYNFFKVDTGSLNLPGLFTGKAGVALALIESVEGMHWLPAVLSAGLLNVEH